MKPLIILALLIATGKVWSQTPNQEREFLKEVEAAFQKHDPKPFLSLYCWEGVDAVMRKEIEEQTADELKKSLAKVELVPLNPNEVLGDFTFKGMTYTMNLAPLKRLSLSYEAKSGATGSSMPVGLQNGKIRLIASVPVAGGKIKKTPTNGDWEQSPKINIQTKTGTITPTFLEMIARQYLKEHQIAVESGAPIINVIVCDAERMAQVNLRKSEEAIQVVEIGADQKVTRTYELKLGKAN